MESVEAAPLTIVDAAGATFDVRELWGSRELLWFLVWRDLKVRYRQTLIGVGWAILQPLAALLVLTVVFGRSAHLQSEGIPYPLFVYAGLLAWTFFANALFSSSNSLLGSGPLITKVYFPRVLIPVAAVGARVVDLGISAVLLAAMMAYYGRAVSWRVVMLLPLVAVIMLLALAFGMYLSALNVRYRDVQVALPHVLQFLLFATPVFYSATILPHGWRWMAEMNPIAALIGGFRAALFGQPFDVRALLVCTALTLLLLAHSTFFFRRMEDEFADVL